MQKLGTKRSLQVCKREIRKGKDSYRGKLEGGPQQNKMRLWKVLKTISGHSNNNGELYAEPHEICLSTSDTGMEDVDI